MRFRAHRVPALILCLVAASAFAQDVAPPAPPAPPAAPPAPAAEAVGEKVQIAIRMEKGQKVWLKHATTMDTDVDMGAMKMSTQMETNQIMSQACDAVDDKGVMTIRHRVARIWGTMVNPMMGEIAFDSDKPDEGSDNPMMAAMTQAMTAIAGKEMQQRLTPTGKSLEMKTPDGMAGDPAADAALRQMLDGLAGVAMLPENSVGVGDTWDVSTAMAVQGMSLVIKIRNTVKRIETDRVTVDLTGTVAMGVAEGSESADGGGNPMAEMMKKMKIEESSMKGTTVYSRKDGLPLSTDIDQTMKMSMELPPEAAAQGATGMKMEMKQKQKITRIDEPAAPKTAPAPDAPAAPTAPSAPPGPGTGEK